MKKTYMVPSSVDVRLNVNGDILDGNFGNSAGVPAGGGYEGGEQGAKKHLFDAFDENEDNDTHTLPHYSVWDD